MTLFRLAGSMLLALSLAALSALVPPALVHENAGHDQALAASVALFPGAVDTRLAATGAHRAPGLRSPLPIDRMPLTIPPAGEIVPGAGQ